MLVFDGNWVLACALLWLRLGALLLLTPLFTLFRGPVSFRVLLTLALAGTLAAGLPMPMAALPSLDHPASFALAALSEVMVGAVMAFGIHAAFGALHFVSRLLDLQIGLGIGGIFDPATRGGQTSALGMGLQLLGVVVFFALEAHHALLRGVVFSVEQVPLGTVFTAYAPEAILAQFGLMFSMALALGAPVIFVMLLMEAGLGVVSRVLPQMQVFFVALPAKLLVGLLMLALTAQYLAPVMGRTFASIFRYWQGVLG